MEYYSVIKMKEILPLSTTLMDLEGIMSLRNKSDRKRQILYTHLYVESKKTKLRNRKQIGSCQKWRVRDGKNVWRW